MFGLEAHKWTEKQLRAGGMQLMLLKDITSFLLTMAIRITLYMDRCMAQA